MNPLRYLRRRAVKSARANRKIQFAQQKLIQSINKRYFTTSRVLLQTNGNGNGNGKHENGKQATEETEPVVDPRIKELETKNKELESKTKELEKMVEELRAGYRGAVQEQDNIRKRAQKEVEKAKEFGVEKLCKHLFNVNDTMNIILQNRPDFTKQENTNNIHAKSAFEGMERVKDQFKSALHDAYEIEEFLPTLGDSFDPLQHNALFEVDPPAGASIAPGKVGLLVKSGWKRKGALLRPAAVGVVKAPPKAATPPPPPPPPPSAQKPKQELEEETDEEYEDDEEDDDIDDELLSQLPPIKKKK